VVPKSWHRSKNRETNAGPRYASKSVDFLRVGYASFCVDFPRNYIRSKIRRFSKSGIPHDTHHNVSIFQDCGYALYASRTKSRRFSKTRINKIKRLPNCGKQKKGSRSTGFPERGEREARERHRLTARHGSDTASPTPLRQSPWCLSEDCHHRVRDMNPHRNQPSQYFEEAKIGRARRATFA
jgi:hypothetical protein